MAKLSQEALEKKIKELDELIELAESVSKNMSVVVTNTNKITLYGLLILIICPFAYFNYFADYLVYGLNSSFLLIFIILVVLLVLNAQYRRVKILNHSDGMILERLYNMISSHKQSIESDLGLITSAIYEMKLSRIRFHFSVQDDSVNSIMGYLRSVFLSFKDL